MFKFIRDLFSKKTTWVPITRELAGKDNLFKLTFDENWFYSVDGNSFYSIHNEIDEIKGGIQISIIWDRAVIKQFGTFENLKLILEKQENTAFDEISLSNERCLFLAINYADSNLDYYYWYLFVENEIYFKISYFIYEAEEAEFKKKTFKRVERIVNSLELNREKFIATKMK